MSDFSYRKVNPHDTKDVQKCLDIQQKLNTFLNSKAKPLTEEQVKWLRIRMGAFELLNDPKNKDKELATKLEEQPDEVVFFCELNDEVVGFSAICNYHVVNGERPDDDIGIISDIFVDEKYRNGGIAYELLQLAIDELIAANKKSAIMVVQEDNQNRFLHFAIADKILSSETISRKNGKKTINYELLINDISKIKNLSPKELGIKALKVRKKFDKGLELINLY